MRGIMGHGEVYKGVNLLGAERLGLLERGDTQLAEPMNRGADGICWIGHIYRLHLSICC